MGQEGYRLEGKELSAMQETVPCFGVAGLRVFGFVGFRVLGFKGFRALNPPTAANPSSKIFQPFPAGLGCRIWFLNPKPQTLNPKPQTLHPKP